MNNIMMDTFKDTLARKCERSAFSWSFSVYFHLRSAKTHTVAFLSGTRV